MKKISIWAITPDGMKVGKELFYSLSSSDFFISENIDDGVHSTSTNIADAANLADAANSLNRDIITKQQINSKQRVIIFEKLSERFQEEFKNYDAHIAVFSTGIAVRILAPLINSKLTDPAVVVIDDRAIHAVSLLSGHLGGANELTLKISEITGASPVITTATDIHNLPSIDMIAKKNNLFIENPNMIKKVNMAFLQKKKINIIDPFNLVKPHTSSFVKRKRYII
ncbi:cobalamin (vitamin B12) biosynthesis CbiG protein [Candidatus Magnetoovum chiemensis]|nr:cobalamin (vitamin B12) biosynthesis CbiG protein [Candidatus Magnetoovum chiemensis]